MTERRRIQLTEKLYMMVGGRMTKAEADALAAAQRAANQPPVAFIAAPSRHHPPADSPTDPAPR